MAVIGQMQTVKEEYAESQTDTVLIACPNGRSIFVWNIAVVTGDGSDTIFKFGTNEFASWGPSGRGSGLNLCTLGGQNEDVVISCPANTTIRLQYTLE
jgi:hypothetical protein